MTRSAHDPFLPALTTAHRWLADVQRQLDTDDAEFAYRLTRAWLLTVRDRLPVAAAAHFAAQLPELLRGVFFEGWQPAHVPVKRNGAEVIEHFATLADVPEETAPLLLHSVTDVFERRMSGHLEPMLGQLPQDVRAALDLWHEAPTLHELLGG